MKKKWWILVVGILLLLLIPIPTGNYKDGGTKEYTALTYKIVKWNRIIDESQTYSKTKIYPFPLNFKSIDYLWNQKEARNYTDTFGAASQYIRTNKHHSDLYSPVIKIIRSVDELNSYYEQNKDLYDLTRHDKIYSDTTIGFQNACDKYDDNYFKDRILVLVVLQEGSGSIRHEVTNVKLTGDNRLLININENSPELLTCDMAAWHIFIEPASGVDIIDETYVDLTV